MIDSRRLFSNASVSVVQVVVSGVVMFFLYRYLVRQLGTEQLGLWSVILASSSVARLSDMGLTGSVVKFVARYRALDEVNAVSDVIQTAAISIAVVMGGVVLVGHPLLSLALEFVVPEAQLSAALAILPWALFSLWLGSVAGVFQSALDGCQRMDIKNLVLIFANVLYFVFVVLLVPRYGLQGAAIGQVLQALILVLMSWILLKRKLSLPVIPQSWSKAKFKEMFSYAVNFQVTSIALLLFEPTTKLLMGRYAGLSSTAYFEMASQFVVRLRALLVVANQALVPAVAELHETAPGKIRELYLAAYRFLALLVFPFYVGMAISLPWVSIIWLGYESEQFVFYGLLLIVGWGFNNLIAAAYCINIGTGDLKRNSIPHVVMSLMNIVLGGSLGYVMPEYGVVIGAMVSLMVASGWILCVFHKRNAIPIRYIFPVENLPMMMATTLCLLVSLALLGSEAHWLSVAVYVLIVGALLWLHPSRKSLLERFASKTR